LQWEIFIGVFTFKLYLAQAMVKSSHVFFGWTNPTGDLRLPELGEQEQVSLHSLTALLPSNE
jgi:hypothetical protein